MQVNIKDMHRREYVLAADTRRPVRQAHGKRTQTSTHRPLRSRRGGRREKLFLFDRIYRIYRILDLAIREKQFTAETRTVRQAHGKGAQSFLI